MRWMRPPCPDLPTLTLNASWSLLLVLSLAITAILALTPLGMWCKSSSHMGEATLRSSDGVVITRTFVSPCLLPLTSYPTLLPNSYSSPWPRPLPRIHVLTIGSRLYY